MNILVIPSWYPTEAGEAFGSFFREQSIAEAKIGNFVVVLNGTFAPYSELFTEKCRTITAQNDCGVHTYSKMIPSLGFSRNETLCLFLFKRRIFQLLKYFQQDWPEIKFDIIHAHASYPGGFVACELGKELHVPVVITEHRSTYLNRPIKKTQLSVIEKCINECSRFLCVGEGLRKNISDSIRQDPKISVLPNMVSDLFFSPQTRDREDKSFVFISVGGLIPRKRHLQLVKCFTEAFDNGKRVKLIIVGEGEERERLEKFILSNNLNSRVELKGQLKRDEVVNVLKSCDAFVLSSNAETFGVCYAEALACGLPVIGTRNGGADDIINKDNGILVDVDNDEQLIDALRYMFNNRQLYDSHQISENARAMFSEESIIGKLFDIYKDAIEEYRVH